MRIHTKTFALIFFLITSYSTIIIRPVSTGFYRLIEPGADAFLGDPELSLFILANIDLTDPGLNGIYVKDTMQLSVVDQPTSEPGFVSSLPDTVTDFSIARSYGSIGLLAHNSAAGELFFYVKEGDEIVLVFGNGQIRKYLVSEIRRYEATSPLSPYSSFIDLTDTERILTYQELFMETYGISDRLILQTCISNENNDSWGRLIIIAKEQPCN